MILNMKKIGIFVGLVGILFVLMSPILTMAQVQTCTSPGVPTGCTPASGNGGPDTYKIENPITVDSI